MLHIFFDEKLKILKSMIFSDVTFHYQKGYSEEKSPVTVIFKQFSCLEIYFL